MAMVAIIYSIVVNPGLINKHQVSLLALHVVNCIFIADALKQFTYLQNQYYKNDVTCLGVPGQGTFKRLASARCKNIIWFQK
jgi:hypothetical protein